MENNHDRVVQIIRQALKTIDDAEVPAELRPTAFAGAMEMIRASRLVSLEPAREIAPINSGLRSAATMARMFGVAAELLDMVYDSQDGGVELVIHRSKLPTRKAPAMKAVAMLVAAGRQAGGVEEWTPVGVIRDVCRQIGVLDLANFATEVASLGDIFLVRGRGQGREFKVTRHGFEEAGRLIAQLVESV